MENCSFGCYKKIYIYMILNSKTQTTEMNQDTKVNSSYKHRGMLS